MIRILVILLVAASSGCQADDYWKYARSTPEERQQQEFAYRAEHPHITSPPFK